MIDAASSSCSRQPVDALSHQGRFNSSRSELPDRTRVVAHGGQGLHEFVREDRAQASDHPDAQLGLSSAVRRAASRAARSRHRF